MDILKGIAEGEHDWLWWFLLSEGLMKKKPSLIDRLMAEYFRRRKRQEEMLSKFWEEYHQFAIPEYMAALREYKKALGFR